MVYIGQVSTEGLLMPLSREDLLTTIAGLAATLSELERQIQPLIKERKRLKRRLRDALRKYETATREERDN